MTVTISRLFDDRNDALRAVQELEAAGVPRDDISFVSNNSDNWHKGADHDRDGDGVDDRAEGAGTGAGVGAAIGGAAGLLAGLGMLAIPGIGPVVAAGWLASTAAGAVAGSAAGGIIGALTQAGVSREDAELYAEGVRRGGTLVSTRVADADQARLDAVLQRSSVDLAQRRSAYQSSGWKSFDEAGQPYGADEVTQERDRYRQR